MNKPIILTVVLSVACSIGFIAGYAFNEAYQPAKADLIKSTVNQYSDIKNLLDTYSLIVHFRIMLDDLDSIKNTSDVETLKTEYKTTAMKHINSFRHQLERLKKDAARPEALYELEKGIDDIEHVFTKKP